MAIVPLYDTLGAEAITYIVNKGTSLVFGWTLASLLVRFGDFTFAYIWFDRDFIFKHTSVFLFNVILKIIWCQILSSQTLYILELIPHCISSFPAELSLIFVDKPGKADMLLEGVENKLTTALRTIVLMDSYDDDLLERGKKCGVEIISMKALEVSPSASPTSRGFPRGHFDWNMVSSATMQFTSGQSSRILWKKDNRNSCLITGKNSTLMPRVNASRPTESPLIKGITVRTYLF